MEKKKNNDQIKTHEQAVKRTHVKAVRRKNPSDETVSIFNTQLKASRDWN